LFRLIAQKKPLTIAVRSFYKIRINVSQ